MAKNAVTDWDVTAGNNTDVSSVNIAEGMAPSDVNNAIRAMMAQLAKALVVEKAISGLVISNDSDADHDISISAGACMDSGDAQVMRRSRLEAVREVSNPASTVPSVLPIRKT